MCAMQQDDDTKRSDRVSSLHEDVEKDNSLPSYSRAFHYDPEQLFFSKYRYRWDAFKWDGPIRSLAISCMMECLANFFITLPAVLTIADCLQGGQNVDDLTTQQLQSIATAYCIGVAIAIICFIPVAGGQIHSSITVILALLGMLDLWKVPFLLLSQVLGCFLAEMYAAAIYWNVVAPLRDAFAAQERPITLKFLGFSALFSQFKQQQRALPHILVAELVTSFLTGIVLCSCFDSSNAFISIVAIAPLLGAYFGLHVLAFLPASALGHPGHNLGSRLACWTLLGHQSSCFTPAETANDILTPILGMLLGVLFFILFMADSRRPPARVQIARSEDRVRKNNRRSMVVSVMRERELEEAELQRRVDLRNVELAPPHPHSNQSSIVTPASDSDLLIHAILRHGPKESIQDRVRRSLQLNRRKSQQRKAYSQDIKGERRTIVRRRSSYLDVLYRTPATNDGSLHRSESYHGNTSTEHHHRHRSRLQVDIHPDFEGDGEGGLQEILHHINTADDDDDEDMQLQHLASQRLSRDACYF